MELFQESRFRSQVDAALKTVKTVLDNTKNPQYASDVDHTYDDKYLLAEFLGSLSLSAQLQILEKMGLSSKGIDQCKSWAKNRSVTLRLKATEKCSFDREVTRKEDSKTEHVREYKGALGSVKRTDKTVYKITEYFWNFSAEYEIFAFEGNNPKEKVLLASRSGGVELMTSSKNTPQPKATVRGSIDVNCTYLFQKLNEEGQFDFKIDRSKKSCRTPRRNDQVTEALAYFSRTSNWFKQVKNYFTSTLFPIEPNHGLDLNAINDTGIFIPVLPLFQKKKEGEQQVPAIEENQDNDNNKQAVVNIDGSAVLPLDEFNSFLEEQKRSLKEKIGEIGKVFPENKKLITVSEASLCVVSLHGKKVSQYFSDGIEYIEFMLRQQLISAIGKVVKPSDFADYMRYHNRRLFKEEYRPQSFCYAIRRPDHYPEGILSIEAQNADGSLEEPIVTLVSHHKATVPMKFAINAATNISFKGDRFLHGWVNHSFSGQTGQSLKLAARARQFSSFLVLVGKISGPQLFDPKYAIIIKNKDDLNIPLDMETIPTPKEFKDSISSLSPEQQRFATAFRSMQLASTLFGVVVIQIKPQLEKLLNIPEDSLTKEIQLTEDLMELFIEYQIPSDLLSYDGDANRSVSAKVDEVKNHVVNIQKMIEKTKNKQLGEKIQETLYQNPELMFKDNKKKNIRVFGGKKAVSAKRRGGKTKIGKSGGTNVDADERDAQEEEEKMISDRDYTQIPQELDGKIARLDEDAALRSTIIKASNVWQKKYKKGLLSDPITVSLTVKEQADERNKAYDLLDALSKSGVLEIDCASLHVILAATHCFDKSLMNTVIQDNVNPIEKVERSSLIIATSIHEKNAAQLVNEDQIGRVDIYSPALFVKNEDEEEAAEQDLKKIKN